MCDIYVYGEIAIAIFVKFIFNKSSLFGSLDDLRAFLVLLLDVLLLCVPRLPTSMLSDDSRQFWWFLLESRYSVGEYIILYVTKLSCCMWHTM